jgi:RNase P/RNase MRP subunit POP5
MDLKLKSSQKDNRRYLIISSNNEKIEDAILKYIGVLGFARSAYIKVSEKNSRTIAGMRRESLEDVKAALVLAGINVEKVSGTLKGLER